MRYHYTKPKIYLSMYGERYTCNHVVYDVCTLFKIGKKGLAVIQQRFNQETKRTWWGDIDPWITDELYLNRYFKEYFDKTADVPKQGLYPTVTIRQIMHGLKMKPLPKEKWETVFDRSRI